MKLSTLAIALGLLMGLPQIIGIVNPKGFASGVRKFPRSLPWGYALMIFGTAWFLYYLSLETNSDIAPYKKYLFAGFGFVGIASCFYVKDFLAVRGLAVVSLMLAKLMVDTARWAETDWRWVISGWAYFLVVMGMWLTISPWRLRDFLNWGTATEKRVKIGCALRLAFGLFVAVLGFTVFLRA